MKKNILLLLLLAALWIGCSSDHEEKTTVNAVPSCIAPPSPQAVQNEGRVQISMDGENIQYLLSITDNPDEDPQFGNIFELDNMLSLRTDGVGEPGDTRYIYVTKRCSGGYAAWSAATTLSIQNYCNTPNSMVMNTGWDGIVFSWEKRDPDNTTFEVEYGPSGFTIGSGTLVNVGNATSLRGFPIVTGNVYDFYVRSYCNVSFGYSEWFGPYSYTAVENYNLCTAPSNLTYTIQDAHRAYLHWNYNGESDFEYALISGPQTIETATLQTTSGMYGYPSFENLSSDIQYQFFVRAVCANGNRTPWTTILIDF